MMITTTMKAMTIMMTISLRTMTIMMTIRKTMKSDENGKV